MSKDIKVNPDCKCVCHTDPFPKWMDSLFTCCACRGKTDKVGNKVMSFIGRLAK